MFKLKYGLKTVTEIEKQVRILPHEKYKNASISVSSSAFSSKFILFLFARRGSQSNKKIFPQRPPLPPPFRHLILHFGRVINTYVPKNKNKI